MLVAASDFSAPAGRPMSRAAVLSVCSVASTDRDFPSPRSVSADAGTSVRAIGPYAPEVLGAPPCPSQRDSLYDTASSTLSGTPNSCAALANAACRVADFGVGSSDWAVAIPAAANAATSTPAPPNATIRTMPLVLRLLPISPSGSVPVMSDTLVVRKYLGLATHPRQQLPRMRYGSGRNFSHR